MRARWARPAFSLVEIMLAILVMALALIPIVSLIQAGTRQTRFNEQHVLASLLAAHILERYREEPREVLESLASSGAAAIREDPLLTPVDADAAGFRQLISGFERSVEYRRNPEGVALLVARVRWQPPRMQPQGLERKLVLAPNPALGAVQ
jgi:type II secretory pathway pseudopilin PulG